MRLSKKSRWQKKQELAAPSRFYGDNGTIHRTTYLDVETCNGEVVSVWFRCQQLAFAQTEVSADRAAEMRFAPACLTTGVQVEDLTKVQV